MKQFFLLIATIIILATILAYVSGEASEKKASEFYGRAHIIEVQNEARKDLMAGLMPYTVLGLGVLGIVVIIVIVSLVIFTIMFLHIKQHDLNMERERTRQMRS